jgi:hypothetical protein
MKEFLFTLVFSVLALGVCWAVCRSIDKHLRSPVVDNEMKRPKPKPRIPRELEVESGLTRVLDQVTQRLDQSLRSNEELIGRALGDLSFRIDRIGQGTPEAVQSHVSLRYTMSMPMPEESTPQKPEPQEKPEPPPEPPRKSRFERKEIL